jgi:enamine deaminase RidA (YjgF/YER057c/UK114 family)
MNPYQKLEQLGISLPKVSPPAAAYVMAVQAGNLVFVAGHIARKDGKVVAGQLGSDVNTEQGKAAARAIGVDLLTTLHNFLGDLNRIERIVKVMCLVNSVPSFTEQHLVANGCSELLNEVFGESGRHARSAFGVAQVPLGACVEIDLVVQVK